MTRPEPRARIGIAVVAALVVAALLSIARGAASQEEIGPPVERAHVEDSSVADPVTPARQRPPRPPRPTTRACPERGNFVSCLAIRQTDTGQTGTGETNTVQPQVSPSALPPGFGPADLRSAYNITATGSPDTTVAVVVAFDAPSAEADLATYRSTYGLPPCTTANGCFRKVNQNGQASPLPAADAGWAGEAALDIQMVSAICPNCRILLVEGNQPTISSLGTAVNTAVALGAKFVSNSYGGPESSSSNTFDNLYYNHPGVVITAASGDDGFERLYPASGKGVTAVGGTSLTRDTSARGWSETAWSGAGSACSAVVARPAFQTGLTTGCTRRAVADVAAVADPQTGVAVYQTFGASGWVIYGGTSAGTPIIAAVYALAGNPGAADSANSYPYAHAGALNDVLSGTNGPCGSPLCIAGAGYDGPTGLGTPRGISAFSARPVATTTVLSSSTQPSAIGQAVTFTATVSSPAGTPTGSVTFSSAGTALGTAALVGGQATVTTSALPLGSRTITADYGGGASTNFAPGTGTLGQTVNPTPLQGVVEPSLNPVMTALSDVIRDGAGNQIIGLGPSCAMTGSYQGLSDIEKLIHSTEANDGCVQFVTTSVGPTSVGPVPNP